MAPVRFQIMHLPGIIERPLFANLEALLEGPVSAAHRRNILFPNHFDAAFNRMGDNSACNRKFTIE